jgi:transcriptional regulator with XRE-family HTH domain
LASLFRCERARRKQSLRAVAAATGIPNTTLGRFERQTHEPQASVFVAVWAWIVAGY